MNRRLRDILQVVVVFGALCSTAHWIFPSSGNPPGGYTGSPGDGNTCQACHSGSLISNSANLTITGPSSWTENHAAYTVTVTLTAGSRYGFEMTAESSGGTKRGSWNAGANSSNLGNWIGHNNANTGTNSWSFSWNPPSSAGAGAITLYAVGNAANNDGSTGGDNIHTKTFTIPYAAPASSSTLSTLSVSTGSVGEIVTLTGTDFIGAASTVSFNGTFAGNCTGGTTSLVCSVPTNATTGNVTVKNATGTSNGLAFVVITASPSVTSVTPSFGSSTDTARSVSVSGGNFSKSATFKLTGPGTINATGVTFGSLTSLSGSVNLSGAATGYYNVVVTNPDLQTGTTTNAFQVNKTPNAPTTVFAITTSTGSIDWNWADIADNETGYRVITTTGGLISASLAADVTHFTEVNLQANLQATRRVEVFNLIGSSPSLAVSSYTFAAAPTAPLLGVVTANSAAFSWTTSNAAGTQYIAELATGTFGAAFASSSTLNASAIFAALSPNTSYYLRVKTRSANSVDTAYTSEIVAVTLADAPTNPLVGNVGLNLQAFSWSSSNPADTAFVAELGGDSGFGTIYRTSTTFNTSATYLALPTNTNYFFRVRALNRSGIATANSVSISTPTLADSPTTSSVSNVGTTSADLSWNRSTNPPGVTKYVAQASADPAFPNPQSVTTFAETASFSGLSSNTSYYFRVRAENLAGIATSFDTTQSTVTLAAPPTNPLVGTIGLNSQNFTWSSSNPAETLFTAEIASGSFAVTPVYRSSSTLNTSVLYTAIPANTTYFFRVKAVSRNSLETAYTTEIATPTLADTPTASAAANVTTNALDLTWNRSTNPPGRTVYLAQAAVDSGFTSPISSVTLSESASFTGLTANTSYFLRVRAQNAAGIATAFDTTVTTLTFATAPTALTVQSVTTASETIGWSTTDPAGTGFVAEIGTEPISGLPAIASSTSLNTAATFSGLSINTTYFFRVRARGQNGVDSAYTSEASSPTLAIPPAASIFDNVLVTSGFFGWSTATNPPGTGYRWQLATNPGFLSPEVSSPPITTTNQSFTNLTPNTSYYVRVQAVNFSGISTSFDAVQSSVTFAANPGTPTAILRGSDTFTANWAANNNPGDTRYTVELSQTDFGTVLQTSVTFNSQALFSGLTPSTSYWVRLNATDRVGRVTAFTATGLGRTTPVNVAAPNTPAGTALGVSSIAWTWSSVVNAVTYNVYAASDTSAGAAIATGLVATSFNQAGLSPNQPYSIRVIAVNGDNEEGAASSAGTAYTLATPPTGTNGVSLSSGSIRVQWTAGAATAYALERSQTSGSAFSQIVSSITLGSAVLFTDTALSAGTTYFYRVRSYNHDGIPTAFDAEASTRTRVADVPAPSGLAGAAAATSAINSTWNAVPFASSYILYAASNTNPSGAVATVVAANFSRTGLVANTAYGVRVAAINGDGFQGALSGTVTTFTQASPPTGTATVSLSSTNVNVSWSASGATAYALERSVVSGSGFSQIASSTTLGTGVLFADTGLAPVTTYFYRVRGFNGDGVATAYDAESSTRTRFGPIGAPTGLAGTFLGVSSISFTWSAVPLANAYNVYTSSGGILISSLSATTYAWTGLATNTAFAAKVSAINGDAQEGTVSSAVSVFTAAQTAATPLLLTLSSTGIRVTWSAVTATAYALERSLTSGTGFAVVASSTALGTATQFDDAGLSPTTTYFYRVQTFNGSGLSSPYGAQASTRTLIAPAAAPAGFAAAALGVSSITWSWNATALAASYTLYATSNTAGGAQFASGVAATSFIRTGLASNTQYASRVLAVNGDHQEGALSASVAVYTLSDPAPAPTTTVESSTSLKIEWASSGATAYGLERSTQTGSAFTQIASSSTLAAALLFIDTGLEPSTTYFYRVTSSNGDGVASGPGAEGMGITAPPALGIPALSGHAVSVSSIAWTWVYPAGPSAANFILFTDTAGIVATLGPSATYYLESGLQPRTNYHRYLQAVNGTVSAFSSTATVATPDVSTEVDGTLAITLTAADGLTKVDIPAGAFNGNSGQASLSVDPFNEPLIPETPAFILAANNALPDTLKGPASAVREFVAVVNGERYSGPFSIPVVITIPYPDADNDNNVDGVSPPLSADNLAVFHLNETSQRWEPITGSTVNKIAKTVSVSVNHFSIFALMGSPAATDLGGLKVFPNPWRPGSGGSYDASGIKFKGLTDSGSIKIFTIAGEHVRTLEKVTADGDEKVWDGKNTNGNKVASGVYLFRVSTPNGNRTGRVAIIK